MSLDLPADLNRLKEEEERVPYDPPYEDHQGPLHPRNQQEPRKEGEEIDFNETREMREPNLPDIPEDDSPTGGVDRRGEAGDQGDDDLQQIKGTRSGTP